MLGLPSDEKWGNQEGFFLVVAGMVASLLFFIGRYSCLESRATASASALGTHKLSEASFAATGGGASAIEWVVADLLEAKLNIGLDTCEMDGDTSSRRFVISWTWWQTTYFSVFYTFISFMNIIVLRIWIRFHSFVVLFSSL